MLPGPCHRKCPVEQLIGNVLAPEDHRRHRLCCQCAPRGAPHRLSLQNLSLLHSPPLPPSAGALEGPFSLPGVHVQESQPTFQTGLAVAGLLSRRKGVGCGGGWDACPPQEHRQTKGVAPQSWTGLSRCCPPAATSVQTPCTSISNCCAQLYTPRPTVYATCGFFRKTPALNHIWAGFMSRTRMGMCSRGAVLLVTDG
ncbi:Hypothetical predicted protein [Marmota monax]|uniref:Uncharacterized protein n=1 Tax=Marmota monax TaxID=9995 RepID=A0A5E4AD63_MARMO|nr:Hypothetical predicted protein [Marmota monax]